MKNVHERQALIPTADQIPAIHDQLDGGIPPVAVEAQFPAGIEQYSKIEQREYSNGAKHLYGVNEETGKLEHISFKKVANAYGHEVGRTEESTPEPTIEDEIEQANNAAAEIDAKIKAKEEELKRVLDLAKSRDEAANDLLDSQNARAAELGNKPKIVGSWRNRIPFLREKSEERTQDSKLERAKSFLRNTMGSLAVVHSEVVAEAKDTLSAKTLEDSKADPDTPDTPKNETEEQNTGLADQVNDQDQLIQTVDTKEINSDRPTRKFSEKELAKRRARVDAHIAKMQEELNSREPRRQKEPFVPKKLTWRERLERWADPSLAAYDTTGEYKISDIKEVRKQRNIAVGAIGALGVIASGVLIAKGIPVGSGNGSAHTASGAESVGFVNPFKGLDLRDIADLATGKTAQAAEHQDKIEHVVRHTETLNHAGDTIWSHAQNHLGNHATDAQIQNEAQRILDLNHINWDDARHLPTDYKFKV